MVRSVSLLRRKRYRPATPTITTCLTATISRCDLTPAATDTTLAPTTTPSLDYQTTLTQIQDGQFVLSPYDTSLNNQESAQYNVPTSGTPSQNYAAAYQADQQQGNVGNVSLALDQQFVGLSDPVQDITGEFHVDETDLQLPGPMPLALRRNYSSQNLADNQFGAGWKLSIMPYLAVAIGGTNIYAADMDGAVLAYVQTATNANVWMPTLAANPQLNNNTTAGVGGLANRLRDRIVQTVNGVDHQLHALWSGRQHPRFPGGVVQQRHSESDPALPPNLDGQPRAIITRSLMARMPPSPISGR